MEVIPNGLDTSLFTPCDRRAARTALGLPHDDLVVLFGAAQFSKDLNKGFDLLLDALQIVASRKPTMKVTLALFGDPDYKVTSIGGIPIRSYGPLNSEDSLVELYGAADLFALASRQENLPNTVMEAMGCGTPCVAFDVGGVGDLVSHGKNGYLAKECNQQELAEGIIWMLEDPVRRSVIGQCARQTIESGFSIESVVERYRRLYDLAIERNLNQDH
jgi:glycosyltransferase involved in cell wall biosynthesis